MKHRLDFIEFQQNGWWGPVMCETIRHLSSHVSVKLKSFKFKKWSNSNKTLLGVLKTGTGAEGGPVILNPCSEKRRRVTGSWFTFWLGRQDCQSYTTKAMFFEILRLFSTNTSQNRLQLDLLFHLNVLSLNLNSELRILRSRIFWVCEIAYSICTSNRAVLSPLWL